MSKRNSEEVVITTGCFGCGIFAKVVAFVPFFIVVFAHLQIGNPDLINFASPESWTNGFGPCATVRDNALIHLGASS